MQAVSTTLAFIAFSDSIQLFRARLKSCIKSKGPGLGARSCGSIENTRISGSRAEENRPALFIFQLIARTPQHVPALHVPFAVFEAFLLLSEESKPSPSLNIVTIFVTRKSGTFSLMHVEPVTQPSADANVWRASMRVPQR
jgi:hypothetical protein